MLFYIDSDVSTTGFENQHKDLEWESANNQTLVQGGWRGRAHGNLCCLTAQQRPLVVYGGFLQHVASCLDVLWYVA